MPTSRSGTVRSIDPTGSSPWSGIRATRRRSASSTAGTRRTALTGYVRYESERQPSGWIRLRVSGVHRHDARRPSWSARIPRRAGVAEQRCGVRALRAGRRVAAAVVAARSRTAISRWRASSAGCSASSTSMLAMTARGWPARAAGRAELEVTDPVTGVERVVLEVESGSARVTPGGGGAIRCGVGALSAWYSSALRAQDAVRLGPAGG